MIANISGHEYSVFEAASSLDGQRIITTNEDGAVRLWKATTGELIADLRGHGGSVYDA
jgi:WD40 repeat protein